MVLKALGKVKLYFSDLTEKQKEEITGKSIEYRIEGQTLYFKRTDETDWTSITITGLEYLWDATKLGIKTTVDTDYVYTDLKGEKGDTGTIYIPKITDSDDEILLSWSNDGELTNPATINIKGKKGDTGTTLFTVIPANSFSELPTTGETGVIYSVANNSADTNNSFDNYLWYDGKYDRFGSLEMDLSDYYTKSEVDTSLSTKANSSDVYSKTDTYSKTEVDTKITALETDISNALTIVTG